MFQKSGDKPYSNINAKREPAVAGRFYPANRRALEDLLFELLQSHIKVQSNKDIRALIVPHAGYIFSGGVAAAAYAKVMTAEEFLS